MIIISNSGIEFNGITLTALGGKKIVLSENSDSKILYRALEEISRVLLLAHNKDLEYLLKEIENKINSLDSDDIFYLSLKLDILLHKLKEKEEK